MVLHRLGHRRSGVVSRAIRDDEDVAAVAGKHVLLFKVKAFAVGAAVLGIAGAIYAHESIVCARPDIFAPLLTLNIMLALVAGGVGEQARGAVLRRGADRGVCWKVDAVRRAVACHFWRRRKSRRFANCWSVACCWSSCSESCRPGSSRKGSDVRHSVTIRRVPASRRIARVAASSAPCRSRYAAIRQRTPHRPAATTWRSCPTGTSNSSSLVTSAPCLRCTSSNGRSCQRACRAAITAASITPDGRPRDFRSRSS